MSELDLATIVERLDQLVQMRMTEGGTPGLVIALTDRDGLLHAAAYGFANAERREPMTTGHLLETGSIGKSFTAIAILQLHEEGRIDLHAPIRDYLPWFEVKSPYDLPTIHHALAHTSGMIYGTDFAPDARAEVWAMRDIPVGSPPGAYFHYSNVAYKALGLVLEHLEGKPYAEVIRERVLDPLGMDETVATVTHATRRRMAQPYGPFYDDRPGHPSHGFVPETWLETDTGDGCLASSIVDLATYLRMYLNRGQGANGRALSEAAFDLMTQQVVKYGGDDDSAHYGYGIVTSELNDSTVVHHTGGMVGYISAMVGDLNAGVGAVAMINGPGSPRGIAWHALELLQAAYHRRPLPDAPAPRDPARVENATDYAGTFQSPDGDTTLTLRADGTRLVLEHAGSQVTLEVRGKDSFYVPHEDFALHLLAFTRSDEGVVTEAAHGANWYINNRYAGETAFDYPAEWDAYPGHYRSHNPWFSNSRVVLRKGSLSLVYPSGHEEPLVPLPDGSFRLGTDEQSPERFRFDAIVDGVALRMHHSGETYYRFFTP